MKKQILSDTIEWNALDYQIQLATGKSSLKIISMYKYDDSSYDLTKSWQDAIVNVTDYTKQTCRQIADHTIPLQNVIFYGGHVNVHRYNNQPYKIFTFLMCRVNLGIVGKPQTPKIQDCDGVLIPPESEDETFQYNFFVKSHQQYAVKYEVTFAVSDDKNFKVSDYQCSNCENKVPTVFCATQKLYFCEDCCSDHHKTKLMQTHKLQQIDKVNTLSQCKSHEFQYEYYCLKCEKYLCQYCVQKGVHHQNIEHPIKNISHLYEETLENIQYMPKKHLQKIQVLLYNLKLKKKDIDDNYKEVRDAIVKEYERSIQILEMEVAKKTQILTASQIELCLLKDKIQWSQSFAIFQCNTLKPIHYFQSELKFENEIKRLKIGDFDNIFLSKPDIIYEADVKLGPKDLVERMKKPPPQKSKREFEFLQPSNPQVSSSSGQPSYQFLREKGKKINIDYEPSVTTSRRQPSVVVENSSLNLFRIKNE